MRAREMAKARELRKQGLSVREIAAKIPCAKSSVSGWVKDIALTDKQIERLKSNQDRGRAKAANHPNSPKQVWLRIRNSIIESALKDIPRTYSPEILKILGSALYWAEGYKATRNTVNFSNSDPGMIALIMKFFREICGVAETKFRGVVHIHPHLDKEKAEKFWSKTSGIPIRQFHKTQFGISKASKNKRDTLPLGTFTIVICDVRLQSRIKGWIKGLENWKDIRAVGAIG
ncbi:MAG TPA: hypothetical protein DCL49_12715 [Candidatus Omnitrophica bacterium]|nr:hypothetical protein [Candidatus Omnitrophota bacterium]